LKKKKKKGKHEKENQKRKQRKAIIGRGNRRTEKGYYTTGLYMWQVKSGFRFTVK